MTDLSPAAQAVLTAFAKASDGEYTDGEWQQDDVGQLAAALRAAADQAHPKANIEDIGYTHQNYIDGWKDALDVILDIATELENQS